MKPTSLFNYFPTKEDLFYSGLEAFEAELLAAAGGRERGESALSAFARFVLKPRGVFAMVEADPRRPPGPGSRSFPRAGLRWIRRQGLTASPGRLRSAALTEELHNRLRTLRQDAWRATSL